MGRSWKSIGLGSGFIKSEEVQSKGEIIDTVARVYEDEFDGNPQLVMELMALNRKISMNQHSCELWGAKYGEDYENWNAKPVRISIQVVTIMNKPTAIKVIEPHSPPPPPARKGRK